MAKSAFPMKTGSGALSKVIGLLVAVALLTLVGIVFTFVRARTGSVFASYLMHLGYNSLIGVSLILETHGFTRMPTGK